MRDVIPILHVRKLRIQKVRLCRAAVFVRIQAIYTIVTKLLGIQWFRQVALSWDGQVTPCKKHGCFMRSPYSLLLCCFIISQDVHLHGVEAGSSLPLGRGKGKMESTSLFSENISFQNTGSAACHLHSPSLSQSLVTWPHPVAKEAKKCWNLGSY